MSGRKTTVIGNLTGDPELRFTPSGQAVCNFTVVDNYRKKDGDQWVDDGADFYRCTLWGEAAENAAESFTKGTRVIVTGDFRTEQYEKDGVKYTNLTIRVDEVGASVRWATAKVAKTQRSGGNAGGGGQQQGWGGAPAQQQPQDGGWGAPAPAAQPGNAGWGSAPAAAPANSDPWATR